MTAGIYQNGIKILDKKKPDESLAQYFNRSGESLLFYGEGRESVVTVKRLLGGRMEMANNGNPEASDGMDLPTQKLLAHISWACRPQSRRVFLVGWGTGTTAGSVSLYPASEIHCAEIEPKVFDTASWFKPINFEVWKDPRFTLRFKDARNDLLASSTPYDMIISEPSNNWIPGVAGLFTSEFYELAQSRLTEEGVFVQWLPCFFVTLEDIRTQLRTFCRAFPETQVWLLTERRGTIQLSGGLLLIGSRHDLKPDYPEVEKIFQNKAVSDDLAQIGVEGPWSLLSLQWLNREEMLAFAGEGPLNTDTYPRLEFSAPKSRFRTPADEINSIGAILSNMARCRRKSYPDLSRSPLEDPRAERMKRISSLTSLAASYSRLIRFNDSLNLLRELQLMGVKNSETAFIRGKDLVFSNQDVAEGAREWRKALKMNPNDKKILTQLGLLLVKTGKNEEAFQLFLKGSKKWPDDQGFLFGQGLSQFYGGHPAEAKVILKKVLKENPSHGWAQSLMAALRAGYNIPVERDAYLGASLQP
jgi:spermidine synthase/Flp pilus assembly protein TadD